MNAALKSSLDDALSLRESLQALAEKSDASEFLDVVVTMMMDLSSEHKATLLRLQKFLNSKYGSKSEKLDPCQLEMFSQALVAFEDLHNPSVNQPESTAESQADADTTQAEREKQKAKKKRSWAKFASEAPSARRASHRSSTRTAPMRNMWTE